MNLLAKIHKISSRSVCFAVWALALFLLAACAPVPGDQAVEGGSDDAAGAIAVSPREKSAAAEPAPKPFHPAPDFTLKTLDGGQLTLSDLNGKPVILNFWATWCGPCRIEMPHLERAFVEHADDELVILGVNLTARENNVADVAPFVDQFGLTFPIVMDEAGDVAELYEVRGQPASIFIDPQGIIQMVWYGPVNADFINDQIAVLTGQS